MPAAGGPLMLPWTVAAVTSWKQLNCLFLGWANVQAKVLKVEKK